jgi:hypothetical protein
MFLERSAFLRPVGLIGSAVVVGPSHPHRRHLDAQCDAVTFTTTNSHDYGTRLTLDRMQLRHRETDKPEFL